MIEREREETKNQVRESTIETYDSPDGFRIQRHSLSQCPTLSDAHLPSHLPAKHTYHGSFCCSINRAKENERKEERKEEERNKMKEREKRERNKVKERVRETEK